MNNFVKIFVFILCFICQLANATPDQEKIDLFETKNTKTWGDFYNKILDSLHAWVRGDCAPKEITILKNSSNDELISFNLCLIMKNLSRSVAVCFTHKEIVYAEFTNLPVAIPFINEQIDLIPTKSAPRRIPWCRFHEFDHYLSKNAKDTYIILAASADLELEDYWPYFKRIHNLVGESNFLTLCKDYAYMCAPNVEIPQLSPNEQVIAKDIISLTEMLSLPEGQQKEKINDMKEISERLALYKKTYPDSFERVILCYGFQLIEVRYSTGFPFN